MASNLAKVGIHLGVKLVTLTSHNFSRDLGGCAWSCACHKYLFSTFKFGQGKLHRFWSSIYFPSVGFGGFWVGTRTLLGAIGHYERGPLAGSLPRAVRNPHSTCVPLSGGAKRARRHRSERPPHRAARAPRDALYPAGERKTGRK